MKVYRVEIMIVDHDEIGSAEMEDVIENTRYPNRCINPKVICIDSRDIGEWHDEHPLNYLSMQEEFYTNIFKDEN